FPEMPRQKEITPHEFPAHCTHLTDQLPMVEKITYPECSSLRGIHQKPIVVVSDLQSDAPYISPDYGLPFPQPLGDSQTESFTGGFLKNDIRQTLKSVDGLVVVHRKKKDMDVGIPRHRLQHFFEDRFAFGIVSSPSAGQNELDGNHISDKPVHLDHADWILEPVEPGDLDDQR